MSGAPIVTGIDGSEHVGSRGSGGGSHGTLGFVGVAPALVAALGFVLAGAGLLAHQAWWGVFGVGAGAVALVLMGLYFNPWLLVGIAISGGVLYAGVQALQQT